jgi:hypothetical protein
MVKRASLALPEFQEDAGLFRPERWLEADGEPIRSVKYLNLSDSHCFPDCSLHGVTSLGRSMLVLDMEVRPSRRAAAALLTGVVACLCGP